MKSSAVGVYSNSDDSAIETKKPSEDEEKGNWGSQLEFILTCVGYSVGLGNVWRFPYLAYKNGGGAFLIPYWIMMIFVGFPLYYLEICLGQFSSKGPLSVWSINPFLKGVGYCLILIDGLIGLYYIVIIAYCLFYFFTSLRIEPLWTSCGNSWNTKFCVDSATVGGMNFTKSVSASQEFFDNFVLNKSNSIEELGDIQWHLVCSMIIAWLVVFFVLLYGIGSLGKVVYFASTFPYICLLALLISSVLQDGATSGIIFYLNPTWSKLADPLVWADACVQLFYSLGVCSGGLLTMASYNKFHNNALRDAIIVPIIDTFTSFFSGLVVFAVLGVMAHNKHVDVGDIAKSGPSLAFIVYPEALNLMPMPSVWASIFFFMMCTIGFSSEFSIMETFFSAIQDEFPFLRRHQIKFRAGVATLFFLLAMPMMTQGGYYIFDLIDEYISGFPFLFVALFECIAVAWIYGYNRFATDIEIMLGSKPCCGMRIIWSFITPLLVLGITVFSCIYYKPNELNKSIPWAEKLGLGIAIFPIMLIPLGCIISFIQYGGLQVIKEANKPREDWGPVLDENRKYPYERHHSDVKIEDCTRF